MVPDGAARPRIYVSVDPPIPASEFDTRDELDTLVLAPRHEGISLYPHVSEWPCHVYVCIPKRDGDWKTGPFDVVDWAVIANDDGVEGDRT